MFGRSPLPGLLISLGVFASCAVGVEEGAPTSEGLDGGLDGYAGVGFSGIGGDGTGGSGAGIGGSGAGVGGSGVGGNAGVFGDPSFGGANGQGQGGDVSSGGAAGTGGSTTECMPPQKRCNGSCVDPGPKTGCGPSDCTACPAPFNSTAGCAEGQCTLTCNTGYVLSNGVCMSQGTGGSGSGGSSGSGSGGSTGSCNPTSCPGCSVIGPIPCCTAARRCGCTWAPGAYCL
jgi:hypothetical protein